MTKWTPGPWRVIYNKRHNSINVASFPDDEGWCAKIALVNGRDEATARLIAAAPDLYEATEFVERRPSLVSDKEVFPDHAQVSFELSAGEIRKLINARKKAEGLA